MIDTCQLQGRGEIRIRMRSSERRNMWIIITVVMMHDALRYIALEMIAGDVDGSPDLAISWTFYTDSFKYSDSRSISGRSTTLTCAPSSTSTVTAQFASRISTRWCHEILGGCAEDRKWIALVVGENEGRR